MNKSIPQELNFSILIAELQHVTFYIAHTKHTCDLCLCHAPRSLMAVMLTVYLNGATLSIIGCVQSTLADLLWGITP